MTVATDPVETKRAWPALSTSLGLYLSCGGVLLFWHLFAVVDVALFYLDGPAFPPFQFGRRFLEPFVHQPGGVAKYVAAYLAQSCWSPWLGALVFTVLALALSVCYRLSSRRLLPSGPMYPLLLPILCAALVWTVHGLQLAPLVALLLSCTAAWAMSLDVLDRLPLSARLAVQLALLPVLYWVCGAAFFTAAAFMGMIELVCRRSPRGAATVVVIGLVCPTFVGGWHAGLPLGRAYTINFPGTGDMVAEGQWFLLPLYLIPVLVALHVYLAHRAAPSQGWLGGKLSGVAWCSWLGRLPDARRFPVPVVLAAACVLAAHSPSRSRVRLIRHLARTKQWDAVLEEASRLDRSSFSISTCYAVNQALFQTGQLGERMFAFPQVPESLTMGCAFGTATDNRTYRACAALSFEFGDIELLMGMANTVERVAHEALEEFGPHPLVLWRLVQTNLVKNRPQTARVFLKALTRVPHQAREARELLDKLDRSPEQVLDADPIRLMRAQIWTDRDITEPMLPLIVRCRLHLSARPQSRLAFEFLIAQLLLDRQIPDAIQQVVRFRTDPHAPLPRHLQEAAAIAEAQTGAVQEARELSPFVSPAVRDSMAAFNAVVQPLMAKGDPEGARKAAQQFRETYFYYFLFGM